VAGIVIKTVWHRGSRKTLTLGKDSYNCKAGVVKLEVDKKCETTRWEKQKKRPEEVLPKLSNKIR